MRSLSSTLLTKQESDSANPYVTVDIGGGSSETHSATEIADIIDTFLWDVGNICRDSNGNLFVLYIEYNAQLVIFKSTDGGDTWDGGTNIAGATDASYPVMAIDSNDYLHLIWAEDTDENDEIYYTKITASDYSVSVSAEKAMELVAGASFGTIELTLDSNDIPHIIVVTKVVAGG